MSPCTEPKPQEFDFSTLPGEEDDRNEFKCSKTSDKDLGVRIATAASAFWNSGGGLMVLGVDKTGKPDGGITLMVGHQSRRDWIDQEVAGVTPPAAYTIETVQQSTDQCSIKAGHAVFLIRFGESVYAPHMAPDNRYYTRAGAHTVSARHFIVEALHARRGLRTPILRHVVRRKPESAYVVQLGVVSFSFSLIAPFRWRVSRSDKNRLEQTILYKRAVATRFQ